MRKLGRDIAAVLLFSYLFISDLQQAACENISWKIFRYAAKIRQSVQESVASLSLAEEPNDTLKPCLSQIAAFRDGLLQMQPWALRMLDAMGKPSPAVSEGNVIWPGNYDLCRKLVSNISKSHQPEFCGKYCNVKIPEESLDVNVSLVIGVCVPDTCSETDIAVFLDDVTRRLQLPLNVTVDCPNYDAPLDTKAIVAIVICSLLLLLVVLGTAVDVAIVFMSTQHHRGNCDDEERKLLLSKTSAEDIRTEMSVCARALLAFSVYTNSSKLLSAPRPENSLTCIYGMRFLSITWVVLGHSFLYSRRFSANLKNYLTTSINRWTFQAVSNATFAVDTFFVLSGLLVAYLTLKEMKKANGKLNWFMFYFHRFWRLTPVYMLVMMVYVCLSPYWAEGPIWPSSDVERDSCKDSWWINLLYINNLLNAETMCMGHTWYLAVDMQLYCIVSPLVLLTLFYAPRWGIALAASLVLVHCVCSAALTLSYGLSPGSFAKLEGREVFDIFFLLHRSLFVMYIKPYARLGPYVIGMLTGYFLHSEQCKLSVRRYVHVAAWAVVTASSLAVVYGLHGASTDHPITLPTSALYNAVSRVVWAACVSWVIVACASGNGGFVNTLLSWPAFVPLSRLTYCVYLVHVMIIRLYQGNRATTFYASDINEVMQFFAVLVSSLLVAAVASLAFEAPMMGLEKMILPREEKSGESKQHYSSHNSDLSLHCQKQATATEQSDGVKVWSEDK